MRVAWGTLLLALGGATLAGLVACGDPPPKTDAPGLDLYGRFFAAEPLVVAPNLRWDVDPETPDVWRFISEAELVVHVTDGLGTAEPFVFVAEPDGSSPGARYVATWDDESVPVERADTEGSERVEVTVSGERLTAGLHELRFRRVDPCRGCARDAIFRRIGYRVGDRVVDLAPDDVERLHRIADFLWRGVVGEGPERRSGVLFVGPLERRLDVPPDTAGTLVLEPENLSDDAVEMVVASGERSAVVQLRPGERGELRLDLPAAEAVTLTARGDDDDGLFLWGVPRLAGAPSSRPAIVLVTLDTTRRDAVAPYSGRPELTPTLAALAEEATVFTQAFSTAPWTLPSHVSALTGLFASRHGAGVSAPQVAPDHPTLPRRLREAGYLTAGISAGKLTSYRFGLGLGFAYYRDPDDFETRGDDLLKHATAVVDRYHDQPLFLFVNVFDPHASYRAPERHAERVGLPALRRQVADQPVWGRLADRRGGNWGPVLRGDAPPTPEGLAFLEASYLAEVSFADEVVGGIFDRLRHHGLWESALVIVTADHGELLGEGGYYSHSGRLDPELVEIPLLVKWPGEGRPAREDALVSLVDVFPTVLEVAGLPVPETDGQSLRRPPRRPYVFVEEHSYRVHPLTGRNRIASHVYGVQKTHFRQVVWDEGEECERWNDGAWAGVDCQTARERVLAEVERVLGTDRSGAADAGKVSDEERAALEALGYM